MSGCYECGSEQGSSLQLCTACIARHQTARESQRGALRADAAAREDFVDVLLHSIWTQSAAILTVFTLLFIVFLFVGPVVAYGLRASLIFSVMMTCGIISAMIGGFFWVRMLLNDTIWAIVSVFFPGFIYRYCFLRWDEAPVRLYTFVHFATMAISFAAAAALSLITGRELLEVLMVYQLYSQGIDSEL